jgi:probable addiction module antidote protein
MTIKTRPFDAAEFLNTQEMVRAYLADAFESDDAGEIADAIGVVARARGMTELARQTGLNRQALYRSLSPQGDPALSSVLRVLTELGLSLAVSKAATNAEIETRSKRRSVRKGFVADQLEAFYGQPKVHEKAFGKTERPSVFKGQAEILAGPGGTKADKAKRKARGKLAAAAIT